MKPPLQPTQDILEAYRYHLQEVKGLSPKTCANHGRDVSEFLKAAPLREPAQLDKLTPLDLTNYLTDKSADYRPASLRQMACSLRQFLRFAQQQGWIGHSLSCAVPKIACRTHNLPTYLSEEQLKLLLSSWDTSTPQGQRDLGIGLCLTGLGLRAGEVAQLCLEDLDWRQGILRLRRSKNGQPAQLPLLADIGEAIANYLRTGRPPCSYRQVFLFHQRVHPMNGPAISYVIKRALHACGLEVPHPGAHLLRHTLATHLVQSGASLKEVADLLRHRHLNSAAVYAHFDMAHLRSVAQPWPTEATL